jgi:hypothetical protein
MVQSKVSPEAQSNFHLPLVEAGSMVRSMGSPEAWSNFHWPLEKAVWLKVSLLHLVEMHSRASEVPIVRAAVLVRMIVIAMAVATLEVKMSLHQASGAE